MLGNEKNEIEKIGTINTQSQNSIKQIILQQCFKIQDHDMKNLRICHIGTNTKNWDYM